MSRCFVCRLLLSLAAVALLSWPVLAAPDDPPAEQAPDAAADLAAGVLPLKPADVVALSMPSAPRVRRGDPSELELVLHIAPGYSVMSNQPSDSGFVATEVRFESVANIALGATRFPKARIFKMGEKRLAAYEGEVRVRIPLTVMPTALPGLRELKGRLVYQACNATECLPAVRRALAARLDILP